jgi:hypothetical protein
MSRALIAVLVLCACKVDGSIGRDDPAFGGEGDGSVGGTDDGTADAAGDETAGTGGGDGSGDGGSTLDIVTDGTDHGAHDTETDRPQICTPLPDDSECAACRKTTCCDPLEACLAHDTCTCWWDCTLHPGDMSCDEVCGTDGALFGELHTCTHNHCPACSDAP